METEENKWQLACANINFAPYMAVYPPAVISRWISECGFANQEFHSARMTRLYALMGVAFASSPAEVIAFHQSWRGEKSVRDIDREHGVGKFKTSVFTYFGLEMPEASLRSLAATQKRLGGEEKPVVIYPDHVSNHTLGDLGFKHGCFQPERDLLKRNGIISTLGLIRYCETRHLRICWDTRHSQNLTPQDRDEEMLAAVVEKKLLDEVHLRISDEDMPTEQKRMGSEQAMVLAGDAQAVSIRTIEQLKGWGWKGRVIIELLPAGVNLQATMELNKRMGEAIKPLLG